MGERKGTNKYYPPDFDPKKHRSLDAYHGTHALRERARKLHQGILIIRFEMPYNIWCEGCNNHIGMGVRYNAEKSKIGMYYSTPIYKFRMKCHLCDNHFEIKTDPANHDYVIIEGARRKEQRWDPKENEQIVPEDKNDQKKMATDAMFKIEHGVEDKNKSKKAMPGVAQLQTVREKWKDDYDLNKLVRQSFREKKKHLKREDEEDQALLKKSSLDITLVPEHAADKKIAELFQYRTVMSFQEKQKEKRDEISKQSIFSHSSPSSPATSPSSLSRTSNSSEQTLSKIKLKHDEAHKMLTRIATKHTIPFSLGCAKPKSARTDKCSKQVGIVHRTKSKDKLENIGIPSSISDRFSPPDNQSASDTFSTNQSVLPTTGPSVERDSMENQSMQETVTTDIGEETDDTTIQNVVSSSDGNALNSLMAIYTDSNGDSD